MWDVVLVAVLVVLALVYLGLRLKAVWQKDQGGGACGGCEGACGEKPSPGGFAV